MFNSTTRAKRLLLIFSLTLIGLFVACEHGFLDGWLDDDGISYLCPLCREKGVDTGRGTCERCGAHTIPMCYKYCYDCAKELDCCQYCGIER